MRMSKRRTLPSTLQAMISALRTTTAVTLSCEVGNLSVLLTVSLSTHTQYQAKQFYLALLICPYVVNEAQWLYLGINTRDPS
jgi:ABC-type sugar transport system permease subunit